jgi:excisionase family DNA binding protein
LERKELLTAADAANLLHISQKTILKWAREGKIERVKVSNKIVLFEQESIDTFLLSKTNKVESIKQIEKLSRRKDSAKTIKIGGVKKSSGELWKDLRREVSTWQ